MRFRVVVDGEPHEIEAERRDDGLAIGVDGAAYAARTTSGPAGLVVQIGRERFRIRFQGRDAFIEGDRHEVSVPAVEELQPVGAGEDSAHPAILEIRSPMPGRVIRIAAAEGATVLRGQTLLVLEAMKMQNEIPAPRGGTVREVRVTEGESITADRVVAVLEVR
jgi:3-methylcrotonyl-CoA carboxylase alpha subunit